MREQVLGAGHPDVAQTLDGLGRVLAAQRKHKESEEFLNLSKSGERRTCVN